MGELWGFLLTTQTVHTLSACFLVPKHWLRLMLGTLIYHEGTYGNRLSEKTPNCCARPCSADLIRPIRSPPSKTSGMDMPVNLGSMIQRTVTRYMLAPDFEGFLGWTVTCDCARVRLCARVRV